MDKLLHHLPTIILAIVFVMAAILIHGGISTIEDEREAMKDNLGKEYVINKDTLTIVDFSYINSNYVMNDGRKIHSDLVNSYLDNE